MYGCTDLIRIGLSFHGMTSMAFANVGRVNHRRLSRQLKGALFSREAEGVIAAALQVLEARSHFRSALTSPAAVRDFLRLKLGRKDREEFWAAFLDAQHRVIAFECLSIGTLTSCTVHPREVVRAALAHNAAA